jgi:lipid-A-disaccharide synthase
VDHIGLPNLLAGSEVVPELLQTDARPEKLGAALLRFLEAPELVEALRGRFTAIHQSLKNDASASAAEAVVEVAEA